MSRAVEARASNTPSSDLSVKNGVLKVGLFSKLVLSLLCSGLFASLGWMYSDRAAFSAALSKTQTDVVRLEEKSISQDREIYYAREDIWWVGRQQGVTVFTTPAPRNPTTQPSTR